MLTRLRHILEMIRFSHTLFALPFALLAAVMAWRAVPAGFFFLEKFLGGFCFLVGAPNAGSGVYLNTRSIESPTGTSMPPIRVPPGGTFPRAS